MHVSPYPVSATSTDDPIEVTTTIGVKNDPAVVQVLHLLKLLGESGYTTEYSFKALVRVTSPTALMGDYFLVAPCGNWSHAQHAHNKKPADFFCIGMGWWELDELFERMPESRRSSRKRSGGHE